MRWYFATDESGANGQTGEDAKIAVLSAQAAGGLEPRLLYHGTQNAFTAWMQRAGVEIIEATPSFLPAIRAAQSAGTYQPHSIGHWLRLAIPQIETTQNHVLYTDCDIIFLKPFEWHTIRPKIFAAAPEFKPNNWNYFNAGIMVLNVPAMRTTYPEFESHIVSRIQSGAYPHYDDELALNEAYKTFWDHLDPSLNWKPYWGFSAAACLLHFHGPKLNAIESIAAGHWQNNNPTAEILYKILTSHKPAYQTWLTHLGDALQLSDPTYAIRLHRAASALSRLAVPKNPDLSFLDFNMF